MTNKKTLKTIVFSLGLAAMTLTATNLNAQYDENRFGLQEWGQTSLLGKQGTGSTREQEEGFSITNSGIGQQSAPLGSGLVILLGAGLGYVALKKKED